MADYLTSLETTTELRGPLLNDIVNYIDIQPESKGLEIGFGIGVITKKIANKLNQNTSITAIDLSEDFVNYAQKNNPAPCICYQQGDVNELTFEENSFDWIWSMDALWAGPKEMGCATEDPREIMNKLFKVVKPGGKVYLAFWSSQKMLPGYPLLEARLNATEAANFPLNNNSDPNMHILNVKNWLTQAGFNNIKAKTFAGDISAPFTEKSKQAAEILLADMFWGNAEQQVSPEDWRLYQDLTSPESENYILNSPNYYGLYTYTLFEGVKESV